MISLPATATFALLDKVMRRFKPFGEIELEDRFAVQRFEIPGIGDDDPNTAGTINCCDSVRSREIEIYQAAEIIFTPGMTVQEQ